MSLSQKYSFNFFMGFSFQALHLLCIKASFMFNKGFEKEVTSEDLMARAEWKAEQRRYKLLFMEQRHSRFWVFATQRRFYFRVTTSKQSLVRNSYPACQKLCPFVPWRFDWGNYFESRPSETHDAGTGLTHGLPGNLDPAYKYYCWAEFYLSVYLIFSPT